MCGIAGLISLSNKPVPPAALRRMCDIQAHRGPDDAGYVYFRVGPEGRSYWVQFTEPEFKYRNEHMPVMGGAYFQDEIGRTDFSLAFGHRRLSIIDLSHKGHQPMPSADRRCWVTFNGEIYNYPELRDELQGKGCHFRTRSDTEVLLHLWEEEGVASLARFNGMFAFAMFDRTDQSVTLVRDRFGVKPLYYAATKDFLLFASEPKAILASGLLDRSIDPGALVEYFTFQNKTRRTFIRTVHSKFI